NEINGGVFEIERSREKDFEWINVGAITAINGNKNFVFTDKSIEEAAKYYYRIKLINKYGSYSYSQISEIMVMPAEYKLYQNYPNPFNPSTTIKYALPFESRVEIIIYNMLGQKIEEFNEGVKAAGYYDLNWQPGNLSSGIYFYFIHAEGIDGKNNFTKTLKMLFMK
ncbi:MAG: T9SS type A sorting domain-containing protein, partial [Ignavibacteriaceae bacterium]